MEVVLYQDKALTEECSFPGYERCLYNRDVNHEQKMRWENKGNPEGPQPLGQTVRGYRVGAWKEVFTTSRRVCPSDILCLTFKKDNKETINNCNNEAPSKERPVFDCELEGILYDVHCCIEATVEINQQLEVLLGD